MPSTPPDEALPKSTERRAVERAPLSETLDDEGARGAVTLRVDYRRLNTFFADYARNISKGGMFVRTARPLEPGALVRFALTLPAPTGDGEVTHLELTAEVRWSVSDAEASEEHPAGMGVRFVFADEAERRRVEALVSSLMRASLGDDLTDRLLAHR